MIIMKFGGTSVGSAERIRQAAEIIRQRLDRKPIVVVSAVGGITDMIISNALSAVNGTYDLSIIKEKHIKILKELKLDNTLIDKELEELEIIYRGLSIIRELTPRTFDLVQSFGERMSCKIVASYLCLIGTSAEAVMAYDAGMVTDDNFGGAEPLKEAYALMKKSLSSTSKKQSHDRIRIVTGFIGKNKKGEITTLGRGGSDYTAAIIGAAVNADEIQIWTDVDGIMTCDPRVVKEAKSIKEVSFAEASELAYFGAKVLHPKTIIPAVEKGIPVRVLNTYNPKHPGTLIVSSVKKKGIKAIAFKRNINLISIRSTRMLMAYGFLAKVFKVFEDHKVIVDMIATTEISVSLTVDSNKNLDIAISDISKFADVSVEKNKSIISIVGESIGCSSDVLGNVFGLISKNGIAVEMISQGASDINLSFIVDSSEVEKAVKLLHNHFFGGKV